MRFTWNSHPKARIERIVILVAVAVFLVAIIGSMDRATKRLKGYSQTTHGVPAAWSCRP